MGVDLTDLLTMVFHWVFYPITHWSFTFSGLTFTISDFLMGCALLGIVIVFLKAMAGDAGARLKFINMIHGKD